MKIKLKEKEIELTEEEAKELWSRLDGIYGGREYLYTSPYINEPIDTSEPYVSYASLDGMPQIIREK